MSVSTSKTPVIGRRASIDALPASAFSQDISGKSPTNKRTETEKVMPSSDSQPKTKPEEASTEATNLSQENKDSESTSESAGGNAKPIVPKAMSAGATANVDVQAVDPKLQKEAANPQNGEVASPTAAETVQNDMGPASILRNRPFIIRALKHEGGEGTGQVTGSILSQSLDKMLGSSRRADTATLSMAALRKLMPQMSRYPSLDKFCTPSGMQVDDESISIVEYLELENAEHAAPKSGTPCLNLFFRSTQPGELSGSGAEASAPDLSKEPAVKVKDAPDVSNLTKSADANELITDQEIDNGTDKPGAGMLTESDWTVVLRNCAVFYGWIIDPKTKRIVRAPKPAFRLRSKVDQEVVAKIPDFVPANISDTETKAAENVENGSTAESPEKNVCTEVVSITPKSDQGIPNYRVNDDSRIEITAYEDELTVSMARSDFSEQSTEALVGGGGYGASVSASAGFASSKSSTSKNMSSATTRTLIARYMFPRCDLLLWPDELEPTPELAALIEEIRRTKNITVLRRLHAEYGHLFCQRVTLGGRLLSTKIVKTNEQQTLEEQKESFKTSVGASVSGSYAGFSASASMKHEQAQGNTNINETSGRSQSEAAVFEAVGGDTILATNPKAWSPTVGNYELWRVINREGLSPLAEILSGIPGYAAVQSWFVQAVPALSRYIVLDESHECKARFRITSPTNSLSIPNAGNNVSYYLGHDSARGITPRLNGINPSSVQVFWNRIDMNEDVPIFNPPTYRAPAIFGYNNFDVEGTKYGAEYNAGFVKTEWDIIAPFDDQLMHGTRIIIRSCPFKDPLQQQVPGQEASNADASHIVVFRNAQGEFLPAMSDSDEYQYWRILKTDPSQRHIRPGDEVRLCWDFGDQTTGWRDFSQDVFGRRQVSPPEASSPLFLKVPWPRFEVTGTPTALIMSPDAGDLAAKTVNIDQKGAPRATRYCLQDLRMRIDHVGNGGRGDADDYLLNKLTQEGVVQNITVRQTGYPMQMRQSMFWFGLF